MSATCRAHGIWGPCSSCYETAIATLHAERDAAIKERNEARAKLDTVDHARSLMANNAFARLAGDLHQMRIAENAAIARAEAAERVVEAARRFMEWHRKQTCCAEPGGACGECVTCETRIAFDEYDARDKC